MLAGILATALAPGGERGWPCTHCGTAVREAARATARSRVDTSGPVPLYE